MEFHACQHGSGIIVLAMVKGSFFIEIQPTRPQCCWDGQAPCTNWEVPDQPSHKVFVARQTPTAKFMVVMA